jgi:hypothetical protein
MIDRRQLDQPPASPRLEKVMSGDCSGDWGLLKCWLLPCPQTNLAGNEGGGPTFVMRSCVAARLEGGRWPVT